MARRTISGAALSCALGAAWCFLPGCASEAESAGPEDTSATIEPILNGSVTTAYPEAALLTLHGAAGGSFACSAALVAPKVVLTAGHCVDGMNSFQITVSGVTATSTVGRTMDWSENGSSNVDPSHHDVGVVILDQPILLASYPTIATAPVASGTQLIDVGRINAGTLTNSFYKAPVAALAGASIGFPYDYAASDVIEHGDSGGPVFLPLSHTIAAINSGANGSLEVLARVDLVSAWIAAQIASTETAPHDAGPAPSSGSRAADSGAAHSDAAPAPSTPASSGAPGAPSGSATVHADAGPSSALACTAEHEANDKVSTANALAPSECGALASATDIDWFTFTASPGQSKVKLTASGDASLSLGYVMPDSSCQTVIPASSGTTSALITVGKAAAPARVCLSVSSRSHKVQTYSIELDHTN